MPSAQDHSFDESRLEALFAQAIALDAEDRHRLIGRVSADDPRLGRELASLLEADEQAAEFLRPPTAAHPRTLGLDPQEIGPYRLLSTLGQGGSSEVYLAVRADAQFRRRVAIKVMKLVAGADQIPRFLAEQQILAGLEHPNIARLYDGGTTDLGLPFSVMEYVEGEPIDEYCDRLRLSLEERVELVRDVCRGVQHAHQNLVVHRDLKPTNILVTADGTPKLLDFGIAKSLNPEITNLGTPPTAPWDRLLTPQYASPEQILGRPTTTASDVYSLGMVLFELLTGTLPYRFDGRSAAEMERQMIEIEARLPSEVIRLELGAEGQELRDRAGARRLDGEGLARHLGGDLDNIVAKALRRDPEHRYGTVIQFADDLERYCLGKPVTARHPSFGYRFGRFLKRHRRTVAVGAGASLLLLASAIGFAGLAWNLSQERDRVAEERDRAQLYSRLLAETFELSAPEQARGAQLTAREIMDRAAERVRWLPSNQDHAKADLMATLGDIYRRLGLHGEAENLLREALELSRPEAGEHLSSRTHVIRNLGRLEFDRGEYDVGRAYLQEVVEQAEARLAEEPLALAEALFDLANGLHQARDYDAAQDAAEKARQIQVQHGAAQTDRLATRMLLANLLTAKGEAHEAIDRQEQILGGYRDLFGDDHFKVASTMNDMAVALTSIGRFEEAQEYHLRALEIRRRILAPTHPEIVQSLNNLASLETYRERPIEAHAFASEALVLAEDSMAGHPNLSFLYLGVASSLVKLNDAGAAEPYARRGYELRRDAFGPRHTLTLRARVLLGNIAMDLGCLEEAEEHFLTSRENLDQRSTNWLRDREVLATGLARLYKLKGDGERAARFEEELEQASAARRKAAES